MCMEQCKTDEMHSLRMRVELRTDEICILLHTSYDIMAVKFMKSEQP